MGDWLSVQAPGVEPLRWPYGVVEVGFSILLTCGVVTISSGSSGLIIVSSSSESLLEASELIATVGGIARECIPPLSPWPPLNQELDQLCRGESIEIDMADPRRDSGLMCLFETVGDDSGVDSGRVE